MLELTGASLDERDRRWLNIRNELEKSGLNGLLVISDGQIERRGSLRYVADVSASMMYGYVIFPLKGEPIGIYSKKGWIKDWRTLPLRGGWVTESEPYAPVIADAVKELNLEKGSIGIEGDFLPLPVYQRLANKLPDVTLKPSNIIHELKMVKSQEELKLVENGVAMVDKAYDACLETARTGKTWNEITSEVCKTLYHYGGEDIGGYPLSRAIDIIKPGDSYNLYPEVQAPGGHWMQFGRLICFGKPKKEVQYAWELDIKAQEKGAEKAEAGKHRRRCNESDQ